MYTNLVYFLILINLAPITQPFQFKYIIKESKTYYQKHEKSTVYFIYCYRFKFVFK
jgi:hypothetical protein